MLVALLQSSLLGFTTLDLVAVVYTVLVDHGLHPHDDMVKPWDSDIATSWPTEGSTAHSCTDHLDRDIGRTLEGGATTELDDVSATLGDTFLDLCPLVFGELIGTDQRGQRSPSYRSATGEDSHSLAVATIGTSTYDLALGDAEVLSELALQTSRVESSERSDLLWTKPRVDEGHEPRDVCGVEDDDHMTYIWAVGLDVLA